MIPFIAELVEETTTTTGTGDYTLAGAAPAKRSFSAALPSDNPNCLYVVTDDVADWELAAGALAGSILTRNAIRSSNGNAAVNWAAGTRRIYLVAATNLATILPLEGQDVDGAGTALTLPGGIPFTHPDEYNVYVSGAVFAQKAGNAGKHAVWTFDFLSRYNGGDQELYNSPGADEKYSTTGGDWTLDLEPLNADGIFFQGAPGDTVKLSGFVNVLAIAHGETLGGGG